MIATLLELFVEVFLAGAGAVEEIGERFLALGGIGGEESLQLVVELTMDRACPVEGVFEGPESAMIPEGLELLAGALGEGHVDVNILGLADAIEASDALFEQSGIVGQVEENEVMGKLEIASLGPDLGANEEPCAHLLVGEPGRVFIPLQQ